MSGTPDDLTPRIDQILTNWSLLRQAQAETFTKAGPARNALVLRYNRAIRRYLGELLRDDDAADEVSQRLVLKLMEGRFKTATPEAGRFRDYLKTAVRNAATDYRREAQRRAARSRPLEVAPEGVLADDETAWLTHVRENVLHNALERLDEPGRTLICLDVHCPKDTSEQLAARLTAQTGRQHTSGKVRTDLSRARQRLREKLIEEIASGLEQPTTQDVEDELAELGLLELVRTALPSEEPAPVE